MRDIKLYFKNKKDVEVEIHKESHQYVFLEPLDSAVVRYVIKNVSAEADTKLSNEVKEMGAVSLKFLEPKSPFLSKISDFDSVDDRTKNTITLALNFDNSNTYILDALYTNKTEEKLKVKVSAYDSADEIVENEHSYIDAPDDFIRAVGVTIDPLGIEYTLLYRRNGRVQRFSNRSSYSDLAKLVRDVILLEGRYYGTIPRPTHDLVQEPKPQSVIDALTLAGWEISTTHIQKQDPTSRKMVQISDEELGDIIKKNISAKDLASLFKPLDYKNNGHIFIREGEGFLEQCDSRCSLPAVTERLIVDQRG